MLIAKHTESLVVGVPRALEGQGGTGKLAWKIPGEQKGSHENPWADDIDKGPDEESVHLGLQAGGSRSRKAVIPAFRRLRQEDRGSMDYCGDVVLGNKGGGCSSSVDHLQEGPQHRKEDEGGKEEGRKR